MVVRSSRPLTSMPFDFALIELVKLISVIGLFDRIGLPEPGSGQKFGLMHS